jgi:hypothetical protein
LGGLSLTRMPGNLLLGTVFRAFLEILNRP